MSQNGGKLKSEAEIYQRSVHHLMSAQPKIVRYLIASKMWFISGLDNAQLELQNHFTTGTAHLINAFLEHQPKPVCLVAHNGDAFDMPILQNTFAKVSCKLPSDVYFADSLQAFRDMPQEFARLASASATPTKTVLLTPPSTSVTPTKTVLLTPPSTSVTPTKSVLLTPPSTPVSHKKVTQQKVSFALGAVYKRLLGRNLPGAHSAEGDCLAMLQIFHMKQAKLLPWIDQHCSALC